MSSGSSDRPSLEAALRGLGIDPQAELERYHRACRHSASIVPIAASPPPVLPEDLPEGYLASSEQLLQSVAASTSLERSPRRPSPLALSGLAVAAAAVGVVAIGLQRRATPPKTAVAPPAAEKVSTAAAIPVPYLASNVNVPLSVATLAQIEPVSPEPPVPPVSQGQAPNVVAAAPNLDADYFYVTLEYSSALLERVRQRIPDALVVKFPVGNRIQVGAFYHQDQAERMAQKLQGYDLPARVYRPE
ncbi:MAG: hypothetical protein AAFY11_12295 [Cyanobacteria bacterium J06641_5]